MLNRIKKGDKPSAIEKDLAERRADRKDSVRKLKKKGLLPTNAERLLPKGLLPEAETGSSPSASQQASKPRETKAAVLRLRKTGKTYKEIADHLGISPGAVSFHVRTLKEKRLLPR